MQTWQQSVEKAEWDASGVDSFTQFYVLYNVCFLFVLTYILEVT